LCESAQNRKKGESRAKNGREPFLTSHSDGQKGGRHGWQTIKKSQHFCWDFLNTLNLDRGLG
jgi:hypothetical protein